MFLHGTYFSEPLLAFGLDIDQVASNDDLFQLRYVYFFVVFSFPLLPIFPEPFGISSEMHEENMYTDAPFHPKTV